eukprot:TRINITY_DN14314_c0_g1_i2.p1 TRINITY_DN14314_c0_g1~~TRINITY_DN14314_c0_g1_i2.p1  ORF type:complete len:447 (+),score=75.22 TRINITY_DN14314_c0_g1_i2:328-1668(+)
MAPGYAGLDNQNNEISDKDPLLIEQRVLSENQDHAVVNVRPTVSSHSGDTGGEYQTLVTESHQLTASENDVVVVVDSLERSLSTTEMHSPPSSSLLANVPVSRIDEFNAYGSRHRTNPLNSGIWILMELTITLSQIIASIIVLALSRHEKPQAPLHVWVLGYAGGCLATLPLLYWRYRHRYIHTQEQDLISPPSDSSSPLQPVSSVSHFSQSEETTGIFQTPFSAQDSAAMDTRIDIFVERFKMALDCFFAIWFVVGNVWIFGGHSSSSEAPNLYRLCIVFLTFSCIGYAMPFILCATICCCLPCIISLLGFREDQSQTKGASSEVINSLPIYKFKGKNENKATDLKDENESDSESSCEGGFVASGTGDERTVPAEDAVCCICLYKYRNDVQLRELPCSHHFHVECVDKWLKINASCPLCKHEIGESSDMGPETHSEEVTAEVRHS